MEAFQKEGIFHSRQDRQIYTPHIYEHILERMYMGPRRTRIYGYFIILRVDMRCNWPYTWDNSPYETDVIKYTRQKTHVHHVIILKRMAKHMITCLNQLVYFCSSNNWFSYFFKGLLL